MLRFGFRQLSMSGFALQVEPNAAHARFTPTYRQRYKHLVGNGEELQHVQNILYSTLSSCIPSPSEKYDSITRAQREEGQPTLDYKGG